MSKPTKPMNLFFKEKIKPVIRFITAEIKYILSRFKIRKIIDSKVPIFIEVGAGNKSGSDGWTTIDLTRKCDIFWDLRRGIPFPNESISRIYSSHFFEHLAFKEIQSFLNECLRVLRPGGNFSICVPNARIAIDAYVSDRTLDPLIYPRYEPGWNNTTKIDYVNEIAYCDGHHKYMFDEENLLHILKSKGFKNVRPRKFDPTIDLIVRDIASIYAEAEK